MKVCMVVPNAMVKGGIASVVNGYRSSKLEEECNIRYVESYCNGSKMRKLAKGILGYIVFFWTLLVFNPDIVHIHSSFGPSFYRKMPFVLIAKLFRKTIVNHIHGAEFDTFYRNASARKRTLIKRIYNKCDSFIALSDEWKENLSEIIEVEKITVIENYSSLNQAAFQERMKRKSNKCVLFLGEIGKRKGCYDIPKIIKFTAEKISDVKFILAGDGTEKDKELIKSQISTVGVEANVDFPGWVRGDEKDRLLREADIFLLPSYDEGMPMSILDAMGYGLPVVSTNVGGIPKLVIDGKNGCCCTPGDIGKMSKAIISILESERLHDEYSKQSYQLVEDKYSLEGHCKKLIELYKKINNLES